MPVVVAIVRRRPNGSLISQRLDWIEECGTPGREYTEHESDAYRDADGDECEIHWRRAVYAHECARNLAEREPDDDADHAADARQRGGFNEKLLKDVGARRADRFANANLASPIGDADHHHRHHADAAHEQRDRRQ